MIRILAVVLALAAFITVPGSAQDGGGLIRIFAVTSNIRTVDVGQPGPSAGDQRIAGLRLYDKRNRVIGNAYRVCTSLGRVLGDEAALCQMVFSLPRGKLVAIGTRKRRDYYVLPVVGGTLLYSSVQGTLVASTEELEPHRRERLLFSLVAS